jgi:4-hydroxy-tetrahydrodipicolinate reductase
VLRVIQWGTGNVGKHSLRAILNRQDLELAGVKVYSEAKRGLDAGELLGTDSIGVPCVVELEDVLAIEADCIAFNGLGSTLPGQFDATIDLLCTLLRNGFNVTSSSMEHLVHPVIVPEALARLSEACAEGKTSFYDTGINPGFTMDLWPITLSRLSRSIDQLRTTEVVDMSRYDSPMAREFMGFGRPPGDRPLDDMHRNWRSSPFYASLRQVADAMGCELDGVRYEREVAVGEKPVEVAIGTLEPGTVAAMRMRFIGALEGKDFLVNEWVWRMTDDVAPDWPTGDRWLLDIEGDPEIHSTLDISTSYDAQRPVSLTVATLNVNAIPALVAAEPGVHTNLTLPVIAGGDKMGCGKPGP